MKRSAYMAMAAILALTTAVSCDSFREASEVGDIEYISVTINAASKVAAVTDLTGLTIELTSSAENVSITETFTGTSMTIDGLIPGAYSISLGGRTEGDDGESYYMGSNVPSKVFIPGQTDITLDVDGVGIKPMIFKEIYYSGGRDDNNSTYFLDQYHEIYNNSERTIYLDNIYIGNIEPNATTATPPTWPAEDGEDYLYGWRVWRFPGGGTDYPLEPGESCVVASQAWDHTLLHQRGHNLLSAEFEFYMNHANGNNSKVPDMEHTYYYSPGGSAMGTIKQYLVPVGGPAMVLFQVPEGADFDPDAAKWKSLKVGSSSNPYLKIPREWVLDVVECGLDETKLSQKRVPGVFDLGMVWTGAQYNGVSVYRRKVGENPDGTPILQDTNNSTNDFLRSSDDDPDDPDNRMPVLRRYGPKVPAWSASHNM